MNMQFHVFKSAEFWSPWAFWFPGHQRLQRFDSKYVYEIY